MNQIIHLQNELKSNTRTNKFPVLTEVISATRTSSAPVAVAMIGSARFISTSVERPSRIRATELVRQREIVDPKYAREMAAARKQVGEGLYGNEPVSFKSLRMKKGFSQTQLAELIGTSQSHIGKIETAKVKLTLSTAMKLSRALGVSVEVIADIATENKPLKVTVQDYHGKICRLCIL